LDLEKHEIQADSLKRIVSTAASEFIKNGVARAVLTDDSGFFVDSLKGFPGPYSSFVLGTIGSRGILKLLENIQNRKASFQTAVAYCEAGHTPISFTGTVKGIVALESKGNSGFGYDPIFIPKFGDGRTFGEMSMNQKNRLSHRAKAFSNFCKWYTNRKVSELR
jgi:XTP/dITP diphosphohydrolase